MCRRETIIKNKNKSDFRSQPSLFTGFHGHSINRDLDRKATIPTNCCLLKITEINTDALEKSGTETVRDTEKNVEKQDLNVMYL
jgi:hypothetical protein